jgi:hypothetical protein
VLRAAQPVPRRALLANATDMNASPDPCGRLPPRTPIIARAVPRGRILAPRPTLRAEPVTINSRSSVSARIAAACGFSATPLAPGYEFDLLCPGTRHKNDLTRVTRIFQKGAFTKTTHDARTGDRRGLFCRAAGGRDPLEKWPTRRILAKRSQQARATGAGFCEDG